MLDVSQGPPLEEGFLVRALAWGPGVRRVSAIPSWRWYFLQINRGLQNTTILPDGTLKAVASHTLTRLRALNVEALSVARVGFVRVWSSSLICHLACGALTGFASSIVFTSVCSAFSVSKDP